MINQNTTNNVLRYIRTGAYTIHDIRDMCNIDHATFHRIVKKASYPRPSTKMHLGSKAYMEELKVTLKQQKTLFPVSPRKVAKKKAAKKITQVAPRTPSASDRLWSQLEAYRLKASKRWIEDQIKVNNREAKALRSLKNRL
jgi:hypothetical protein